MEFALVQHKRLPGTPHEWMVLVDSEAALDEWKRGQTLLEDGAADFALGRIFDRHPRSPVGCFLETMHTLHRVEGTRPDCLAFASHALVQPKRDVVRSGQSILVNKSGGFRPVGSDVEVVRTVTRDRYEWPHEPGDIRVFKWPGGRHWYAKVGGSDVVVDGHQKWNTKRAAIRAAEQFAPTPSQEAGDA